MSSATAYGGKIPKAITVIGTKSLGKIFGGLLCKMTWIACVNRRRVTSDIAPL
jgi:hypothetical protein